MTLKINGPTTEEAVRGKFAAQCVELWRKHHACNYGLCRQRKPRQPAAPKETTFSAARRAVLRASVRAKTRTSSESRTAYGVTAGFFKPPPGEIRGNAAAWSLGLNKFDALTKRYRKLNGNMGTDGRASFPKVKTITSTSILGNKARNYSYVRLLAYLPGGTGAALAEGYKQESGLHACRRAHMVIVDELERLHSEAADVELVLHMLYIVARGLPVTTRIGAESVAGDVREVPRTLLREHKPQLERQVRFLVSPALNARHPALADGLSAIADMPLSCWRVQVTDAAFDASSTEAASGAAGCTVATSGAAPRDRFNARAKAASGAAPSVRFNARGTPKAKARGRPKASEKKEVVRVPDLPAMWAWLKANRTTVNANYTRMCWRHGLAGEV